MSKRSGVMIDLTGQTFNGWQVIECSWKRSDNKIMWRCRCVTCEREKSVEGYNLRSGRSKSCRKCSAANVGVMLATHRECKSPVYMRWQAMKTRCYNPNGKDWRNYGGRGVTVCQEWLTSFEAFRDHIGPMPTPMHTVDRIENDGNYEPGNVRWATQSEQMSNTRISKRSCLPDPERWPWMKDQA
jgi:hypothetical protein